MSNWKVPYPLVCPEELMYKAIKTSTGEELQPEPIEYCEFGESEVYGLIFPEKLGEETLYLALSSGLFDIRGVLIHDADILLDVSGNLYCVFRQYGSFFVGPLNFKTESPPRLDTLNPPRNLETGGERVWVLGNRFETSEKLLDRFRKLAEEEEISPSTLMFSLIESLT